MSQVGWRLMVASSAKTSRPRAPASCGDIARAFATKAAMSSDVEALASGNESAFAPSREATSPDFDLVGSPDIGARVCCKPSDNQGYLLTLMRLRARGLGLFPGFSLGFLPGLLPGRYVWCDRARFENLGRIGFDGRSLSIGIGQEFVEHALDRGLRLFRSGIAHVVMLEGGLHHRDTQLLALFVARNHAGVGLELRVLRAETQDLELARGDEGDAQIVERHDLLDLIRVLFGEIHRDVAAHGMSDHRKMIVVGIGLELLHLLDSEADVGDAALDLREPTDIELADLGHHRRIGRQVMLTTS